jgi:hypothetical protein
MFQIGEKRTGGSVRLALGLCPELDRTKTSDPPFQVVNLTLNPRAGRQAFRET